MKFKDMLELPNLSLQAKGLACVLHAHPELLSENLKTEQKVDWLTKHSRDGRYGVQNTLAQLRKAGILKWEMVKLLGRGANKGYRWYLAFN